MTVSGFLVRSVLLLAVLSAPLYVALSQFGYFEPFLFPLHMAQAGTTTVGKHTYGPYPDEKTLHALKAKGITAVIALLDPALVYEKCLLERERENAAKSGIQVYNFPMDSNKPADFPQNAKALAGIRDLMSKKQEAQMYVHCYLGQHRARMTLRAMEYGVIN